MKLSTTAALLIGVLAGACTEDPPTPAVSASSGLGSPAPSHAADSSDVVEAIAAHWTAINQMDTIAVAEQHVPELTVFATEVEPRFSLAASATADEFMRIVGPSRPAFVVEELDIQFYGDAAVASFYLGGNVTRSDGSVDARRRRTTEVWVRQADGTWKEAHHHDSVFAQP